MKLEKLENELAQQQRAGVEAEQPFYQSSSGGQVPL
jgi:hypothetical protein